MKNKIKVISLIVLMILGVMMIFHQSIANIVVSNNSSSYVENITYEDILKNEEAEADFNASNVNELTGFEAVFENSTNLPVIGAIAIPEMEINLPIFRGLTNANLSVGAGTMTPHQKMGEGNYSLASHSLNYGYRWKELLFTPLKWTKLGVKVYTHDAHNIYEYTVVQSFMVDPFQSWVLDSSPGVNELTLVTCDGPNATKRRIVRATLDAVTPLDKASDDVKFHFKTKWNSWKNY